MKKSVLCLFVLFFTLFCLNCLPVAVGGLLLKSSSTKKQQRTFLTDFNQTNLEREKAGLLPLDLCIAKHLFDAKWAKKDGACRKRIYAYIRGEIDEYGQKVVKEDKQKRSKGVDQKTFKRR